MYRTDDIVWLVDELKKRVPNLPPVRINTNGHANLFLGRDVAPCSRGASTPSPSPSTAPRRRSTAPSPSPARHAGVGRHAGLCPECKEYVPHVVMTIVDKDKTPEEITRCRRLTEDLGVTLRIRAYIPD